MSAKERARDPEGQRRQRAMAVLHMEPRSVRRARVRMTRPHDAKGRKALVMVATFEARQAANAKIVQRRTRDSFRKAGTMPHVSSGKHRKKLADRHVARETVRRLVDAGFTGDSAIRAVKAKDMSLVRREVTS